MTVLAPEAPITFPAQDGNHRANPALPLAERVQFMHKLRQGEASFDPSGLAPYLPEDIGLRSDAGNHSVRVVGEFAIPGVEGEQESHVAILQVTRKLDGDTKFAIRGLNADKDGKVVASKSVPIPLGSRPLLLGRQIEKSDPSKEDYVSAAQLWGDGSEYSQDVSSRHARVFVRDGNVIIEDTSANGSWVSPNAITNSESNHISEHTQRAIDIASESGRMNDRGEFQGRKIITRDTTMGGKNPEATVDIRAWGAGAEAIVVDAVKAGEVEKLAYEKLRNTFDANLQVFRQAKGNSTVNPEDIAGLIYKTVKDSMEYSLEYADETARQVAQQSEDGSNKVNLGWYLHDGKGVCRHMALAAAWLGGELSESGVLQGRVTAEVNQHVPSNSAHEWARFTDNWGEVYIIDPAQTYFGKLDESAGQSDAGKTDRWHYYRDGEKKALEARAAAKAAIGVTGIISAVPKFENK